MPPPPNTTIFEMEDVGRRPHLRRGNLVGLFFGAFVGLEICQVTSCQVDQKQSSIKDKNHTKRCKYLENQGHGSRIWRRMHYLLT
jgi:hypothetical protein